MQKMSTGEEVPGTPAHRRGVAQAVVGAGVVGGAGGQRQLGRRVDRGTFAVGPAAVAAQGPDAVCRRGDGSARLRGRGRGRRVAGRAVPGAHGGAHLAPKGVAGGGAHRGLARGLIEQQRALRSGPRAVRPAGGPRQRAARRWGGQRRQAHERCCAYRWFLYEECCCG